MPKFRKKPVVIEARQFETNNEVGSPHMDDLVQWINTEGAPTSDKDKRARHDGTDIYIETLEGTHKATVGDWIIKGVKGEFYPCKPDIFQQTYEPVEA